MGEKISDTYKVGDLYNIADIGLSEATKWLGLLKYLASKYSNNSEMIKDLHNIANDIRAAAGISTEDPSLGVNVTLEAFQQQYPEIWKQISTDWKQMIPSILQIAKNYNYDVSKLTEELMPEAMTIVNPNETENPKGTNNVTTTTNTTTGTKVPTYNAKPTQVVVPGTPIRELAPKYNVNVDWDATNRNLILKSGDKSFSVPESEWSKYGKIENGRIKMTDTNFIALLDKYDIYQPTAPAAVPEGQKWIRQWGEENGVAVDWSPSEGLILKKGDQRLVIPEDMLASQGLAYDKEKGYIYIKDNDLFNSQIGTKLGTYEVSDVVNTDETDYTTMTVAEINYALGIKKDELLQASYQDLLNKIDEKYDKLATKIDKIYDDIIKTSISNIEKALSESTSLLEARKGDMDESARISKEEIDKSVEAAKETSKSEMVARGIYFSGLTTRALNKISAQGVSEKAKVDIEVMKWKNQIDMQIAVLTANTKMSEAQLSNEYMAQSALQKLQLFAQSEDEKYAIEKELAAINADIEYREFALPYEKELERRQNEAASFEQFLDIFENVVIPMMNQRREDLKLQLSYEQFQLEVLQFFNDAAIDWERLGIDKEKAKAYIMNQSAQWYKAVYGTSGGGTTNTTDIPSDIRKILDLNVGQLDDAIANAGDNQDYKDFINAVKHFKSIKDITVEDVEWVNKITGFLPGSALSIVKYLLDNTSIRNKDALAFLTAISPFMEKGKVSGAASHVKDMMQIMNSLGYNLSESEFRKQLKNAIISLGGTVTEKDNTIVDIDLGYGGL